MSKVSIKLLSPYLPLHESQSETSSTAGNGGVGKRKDSQKKMSQSSATAQKRKSTSSCLLAIPAFDRISGLNNRHLNYNRGICLR